MAKVPTQVVIAAFHEEAAAGQVADALKEAKKQHQLYYRNVAVIRKDEKGKVKVKETGDMSGGPARASAPSLAGRLAYSPDRLAWRPARRPAPSSAGLAQRSSILVLTTSVSRKLATCCSPVTRPSSPFSRKSKSTRRR